MATEELSLKVGELTNRDEFGRGIVRVDNKTMHALGIKEGDIVSLHGKKETGSIAARAYPADVGLSIIRMDGITRRNSGIGVGETIRISKAEEKAAKRVVVAPTEKGVSLQISPEILKRNLFMRPVTKHDIVMPFPVVKQRNQSPFDDFLSDFGINMEDLGNFGFTPVPGEMKLAVISTQPEGIVRITDDTEIVIKAEAVDIEARSVPTITYEDIGGLHEAIQKIREMVELPLRHPELFTKLGIDPPKGVLLYGPPGTGKTLLAKAVANESGAAFTSINGPEVMSKWYGESISRDEVLLVKENDTIKFMPIEDIVNGKKKIEVISFGAEGKVKFSKIKDYFKHPRTGKILEIKTKTGRKIKVTDYHSLFSINDGKVGSIKTSDLREKESYIAIPSSIPSSDLYPQKINLLELLENEKVLVKNCSGYVKKAVKKLGLERTAEILGVKKKYVYDMYGKSVGIPVRKFNELAKEAGIDPDLKELRVSTKFMRGSLPVLMKTGKDFWRLMGIWIAEGDVNREDIRVTNTLESVRNDVKRTCSKLGLNSKVYDKTIFIGSGTLWKVMKSIGFNKYALKKRVPPAVFALDNERLAEFLKGYYTGDGSAYNNQRNIITVEATTFSKGLANDLMYLLLKFGIVASVYEDKQAKNARFRICFRGAENIRKFTKIGFMDTKRNKNILDYGKDLKWERSDQIPMFAQLREILKTEKVAREWANSKTIGRNKLSEYMQKIDPKKQYGDIWSMIENDIYWDRVEEISEIDTKDEFVYDVSVNPTENFLAGFGGIFAHNSEANLRKIFEDAEKSAPSIIFIDEIDAIAPKREEVTGEVERRVVSQILTLMDGLKSRGKVIVIAATNRQNALDPALRRPGRFDRELEIGVPDQRGRKEVLQIHTRNMPLDKDVDLDGMAAVTYGFVGADLEALCKEAAMSALRRNLPNMSWKDEEIPQKAMENLIVTKKDFQNALKLVEPSAMREVMIEIPKVGWKDIGGLEEVKGLMKEVVQWPLSHAQAFTRMGIKPPRGVLLYGPPGTGKTLMARAVAHESGANFISISGPEVLTKWVGESEKKIREIFRRAKQVAPSVIFFDEIDSLVPRRGTTLGTRVTESVLSQILTEMSGLEELHNVVVIAATNRPDMMDPALLRPGRFDRQILVPAPDEKARLQILEIHTGSMPLKGVNLKELAKETKGYSGADLEALCREAGLNALRKSFTAKDVTKKDFTEALKKVKPSITPEVLKIYEAVAERFKTSGIEEKEEPAYYG
jgi:SpoVK/Ycf46/Vps4 family AAA+-type ATPase/intein/homing endonuclease